MTDLYSPATGIDSQRRDAIRRKTVASLPDDPSAKGYSPGQIKAAITAPLLDTSQSLVAEVNRIVGELNTALSALATLLGGGSLTVNGAATYADSLLTTDVLGTRQTLRAVLTTLTNGNISTINLANLSVTEEKLASGSVSEDKLTTALRATLNGMVTDVSFQSGTGVLTFTHEDGTVDTVDLPTESVVDASGSYFDEDTNKLMLRLAGSGQFVALDIAELVTNAVADASAELLPQVVRLTAQTLTAAQKTQVRQNLGLVELPAVTAADNGKLLRVSEGEWAAVTLATAENQSV